MMLNLPKGSIALFDTNYVNFTWFRRLWASGLVIVTRLKTNADIHKAHWQIKAFFQLIKQNLRGKSFVGSLENAVLSQVYVSMIAYLILAWLKCKSGIGFSIQHLFETLQVNLTDWRKLEDIFKTQARIIKNQQQRL